MDPAYSSCIASSSLHHLTRWPIDKIGDCCNLNAATQGQVGRTCPGPEKFREYTCCRLLHGVFTIVLLPQMLVEAGYPELCFGEC